MRSVATQLNVLSGLLLVALLCGCGGGGGDGDKNPDSAPPPAPSSTEEPAARRVPLPLPSDERAPGRDDPAVPPVDLADHLALGMEAHAARPPLTADCVRDHYAERLGERFLRLSCLTAQTPFERRLRLAFLEYADGAPSRLAYHIVETRVPTDALPALWAHLRADAEARHGPPNLVDSPQRLAWSGLGRDDQPTSLELTVHSDRDIDGYVTIEQAYRHRPLVAQLGLPR